MASQKNMILKHLIEKGSIEPLEALRKFGCMRLGARIGDLRAAGYSIKTEYMQGRNREGNTVRWAKYVLVV